MSKAKKRREKAEAERLAAVVLSHAVPIICSPKPDLSDSQQEMDDLIMNGGLDGY
jgi:hypothetical protein